MTFYSRGLVLAALATSSFDSSAWTSPPGPARRTRAMRTPRSARPSSRPTAAFLLSDSYLENDLVAVRAPPETADDGGGNGDDDAAGGAVDAPRLCVVRPDSGLHPLCYHEDDVETDLFVDPRAAGRPWTEEATDEDVCGTYGEGWYGQRPVPSLGGGPGYGAEADEIWSIDEEVLEKLRDDGVLLPVLDVGIAHGEKARGGAF